MDFFSIKASTLPYIQNANCINLFSFKFKLQCLISRNQALCLFRPATVFSTQSHLISWSKSHPIVHSTGNSCKGHNVLAALAYLFKPYLQAALQPPSTSPPPLSADLFSIVMDTISILHPWAFAGKFPASAFPHWHTEGQGAPKAGSGQLHRSSEVQNSSMNVIQQALSLKNCLK